MPAYVKIIPSSAAGLAVGVGVCGFTEPRAPELLNSGSGSQALLLWLFDIACLAAAGDCVMTQVSCDKYIRIIIS